MIQYMIALKLTSDQQKQIKDATGNIVTELILCPDDRSMGELDEVDSRYDSYMKIEGTNTIS
jgi:hypothetical protein